MRREKSEDRGVRGRSIKHRQAFSQITPCPKRASNYVLRINNSSTLKIYGQPIALRSPKRVEGTGNVARGSHVIFGFVSGAHARGGTHFFFTVIQASHTANFAIKLVKCMHDARASLGCYHCHHFLLILITKNFKPCERERRQGYENRENR